MRLVSCGFALICLALCSCTTPSPDRLAGTEAPFNQNAGTEDWLYLNLHLEDGQELLFCLDTGAPVTVLDQSLEARLGKRLRERPIHYAWKDVTGGVFRPPKLYLGQTQLATGGYVCTDDLSQNPTRTNSTGRPVMGILGMDCLRHYCIQLDFTAGKVRLRSAANGPREALGKAFPLRVYPSGPGGYVTVRENFTGTKGVNPIIDTGCRLDALLDPDEFEVAMGKQKLARTYQFKGPPGSQRRVAFSCEATFGGETYTNLTIERATPIVVRGRSYYVNAIGLPFLARHLVTLDFPKQTMYLKRRHGAL